MKSTSMYVLGVFMDAQCVYMYVLCVCKHVLRIVCALHVCAVRYTWHAVVTYVPCVSMYVLCVSIYVLYTHVLYTLYVLACCECCIVCAACIVRALHAHCM